MPENPVTVALTADLAAIQQRWREVRDRAEQDDLYAREFAAPFARLFAALPLFGAPADLARPRLLVSVLGLSWQPAALMAAWARPERMLLIGTAESFSRAVAGERVLELICRVSGIDRERLQEVQVRDPGETEIYRKVRDFLRETGAGPRETYLDPTGGKKSMSASAALAGFLAGMPLVYVDYLQYANRIPVAGTEYPRLLANPLDVLGDIELRAIASAFNRSDFREAEHLAQRLGDRLYEPREAECLTQLARGYGAWDRFAFVEAREALGAALAILERFHRQGDWIWAAALQPTLLANLDALEGLVGVQQQARPAHFEQALPLLAWYLAKAERMVGAQEPSLAVLLAYAAVERYVGLCLWLDYGLDDERPDYGRVSECLDLDRYHRTGRRMHGKNYRERALEGPLAFATGVQLLASLREERLPLDLVRPLHGLASTRNKCEYEHGLVPVVPDLSQAERHVRTAWSVVAHRVGDNEVLEAMVRGVRFPRLELG